MDNKLHAIKGVEIFSSGKWNGDEYSEKDLDEMVRAFEENKEGVRPFLKLGHSEEQKYLEAEGMPAAGWVEQVYRKGNKLMADFFDIPQKVYDLIMKKAYRKVSCEIYTNCEIEGKKYPYLVGAVALLGAETPGVMNLKDILANYSLWVTSAKKLYASQQELSTIKSYSFQTDLTNETLSKGVNKMTDTEKLMELEAKFKKLEAEKKEADEKVTALESDTKKFAAEAQANAEKMFNLEIEKNVDGLLGEKLITPAMKPYVTALLGKEKSEFSIGEKKLSKVEFVKELLTLFKKAGEVNLSESSTDDHGKQGSEAKDALDKEILEYMEKNKSSYSVAYRACAPKYAKALESKSIADE